MVNINKIFLHLLNSMYLSGIWELFRTILIIIYKFLQDFLQRVVRAKGCGLRVVNDRPYIVIPSFARNP